MTDTATSEVVVTLWCRRDDPNTIESVRSSGGSITLGAPVVCDSDDARVELALLHGFPTSAERDYAELVSITFGKATGVVWVVRFEMARYNDALRRI